MKRKDRGKPKEVGRTLQRIVVEVEPDLHRDLKIRAAEEGRTVREIAIEVLSRYLAAEKPKKGGRP